MPIKNIKYLYTHFKSLKSPITGKQKKRKTNKREKKTILCLQSFCHNYRSPKACKATTITSEQFSHHTFLFFNSRTTKTTEQCFGGHR